MEMCWGGRLLKDLAQSGVVRKGYLETLSHRWLRGPHGFCLVVAVRQTLAQGLPNTGCGSVEQGFYTGVCLGSLKPVSTPFTRVSMQPFPEAMCDSVCWGVCYATLTLSCQETPARADAGHSYILFAWHISAQC